MPTENSSIEKTRVLRSQEHGRRREIEYRLMLRRLAELDQHRIVATPLDELDALNHYGFAGKRDMTDRFRVLVIAPHSFGDETLFIAAQLLETNALIVHCDSDPQTLEITRQRARLLQLDERIRFTDNPEALLRSLRETTDPDKIPKRFGPFDYVRCCDALDHADDPTALWELLLSFLKEDGVLGLSCLGRDAREPYRQLQTVACLLDDGRNDLNAEMAFLRELYLVATPTSWPKILFDNLPVPLRTLADESLLAEVMREDRFAPTIGDLYDLLDTHDLKPLQFSRPSRALYQPWFAVEHPELLERLQSLPWRHLHAFSEAAWGTIERHRLWIAHTAQSAIAHDDPDNTPFFHHITEKAHGWRQHLMQLPVDTPLRIAVEPIPGRRYLLTVPWNDTLRQFVTLIDGYKTLGEMALLIREESSQGVDEIIAACAVFLRAAEWEDIVLLRHRQTPILPFTAHQIRADLFPNHPKPNANHILERRHVP